MIKINYQFISADSVAATNATWLKQQWGAAHIKMAPDKTEEFYW